MTIFEILQALAGLLTQLPQLESSFLALWTDSKSLLSSDQDAQIDALYQKSKQTDADATAAADPALDTASKT